MNLTKKDLSLLRELQKDSTQSLKKLSRKLNMAITTIYDRKKKLEKEGVIKKYKAVIDPEKVNKPIVAFIFLRVRYDVENKMSVSLKEIAKQLTLIPGVMEVHIITGQWDLLIKIRGKDIKEIGNILTDYIVKIKGISRSLTMTAWVTAKDSSDICL
ncbi:MAG: Lrp/AsnC family transcriptional regulator [Candidatus Aenigmarchaeota archaeon]|nr:Lrp/AsnC family transcriptional regulator [Candidatus Aenigmarchaeota archaeon]